MSDKVVFVRARHKLRNAIQSYDSSSEVNIFYVNEIPMWLDKTTRTGLMLRFQAEQAIGKTSTTLWYGSQQFEIPMAQAFQLLYALEVYASQCYDNTQRHISVVNNLQSIDELKSYDYRDGYPEPLNFDF